MPVSKIAGATLLDKGFAANINFEEPDAFGEDPWQRKHPAQQRKAGAALRNHQPQRGRHQHHQDI